MLIALNTSLERCISVGMQVKQAFDTLSFLPGTLEEYYALEEEKAEYLPEGIIVISSPASLRHEIIFKRLLRLIDDAVTPSGKGLAIGSRFTIALGEHRVEPDLVYIATETQGEWSEHEFKGVPDLTVEILSRTSRDYDLNKKRALYRQFGVREIWFVDYLDRRIVVDCRTGDGYTERCITSGSIRSSILPDLIVETGIFDETTPPIERGRR